MASLGRPALAQQSGPAVVGAVRIASNECWTGPFSEGVAASHEMAVNGNRYELSDQHEQLFEAVAARSRRFDHGRNSRPNTATLP